MNQKDLEKRLQHQLYLATENPEPIFDVSNCELNKVPQGCFSLCKVLRKKKLYLNNNKIRELNSNNNNIKDLTVITHLYLQSNELFKLPIDIDAIQYLQVLNVSKNALTAIPDSIASLVYLRKLYLRHNRLSFIPSKLFNEKSVLEVLDIFENKEFQRIPYDVVKLPKLTVLSISLEYLKYPSKDVCQKGLGEVLKCLFVDAGLEPNKETIARLSLSENKFNDDESNHIDTNVLEYETFKLDRLNLLKSVEKENQKIIDYHDRLSQKNTSDKETFLKILADEEAKMSEKIHRIHQERDKRQQQLIDDVKAAENNARLVIDEIIELKTAYKKHDKILDEIENEAFRISQMFNNYQEKESLLRKHDVLDAMNHMLSSQTEAERIVKNQHAFRENLIDQVSKTISNDENQLSNLLKHKQNQHGLLVSEIECQEACQRKAFAELQLQKDQKTLMIMKEISWIESELLQLTIIEQKRKASKFETEFGILSERRQELVQVLFSLLEEKHQREKQLQLRLSEMESQREDYQKNFWLVQYQRLIDTKPTVFFEENCGLDSIVLNVLRTSNTEEYLPFFQRNKITWEKLQDFTEDDLKNLSVYNVDSRKRIMTAIVDIKTEKCKKISMKSVCSSVYAQNEANNKSIQSPKVIESHKETECCICLNDETTCLFLQCGHICCCEQCSIGLIECPMCRQKISQIVKLIL